MIRQVLNREMDKANQIRTYKNQNNGNSKMANTRLKLISYLSVIDQVIVSNLKL